jgi:superoxide dismutase, Fe-Mn family
MTYTVNPLACDPARLDGLSGKLIMSHYENNYCGAVKRLNAIEETLSTLDVASAPGFVLDGLKREQLVTMNSMILHELYFSSLGKSAMPNLLRDALVRDFGSLAHWESEFIAMGKAKGGGSGWVLLTYMHRNAKLVNQWSADHTSGIAGATPVLALDMYEHSYHLDYGAGAATYVDTFMRNINWNRVGETYSAASSPVQTIQRKPS